MAKSKDTENTVHSLEMEKDEPTSDTRTPSQLLTKANTNPEFELFIAKNFKKIDAIQWYYAPAFLLFWAALLWAVVLPVFFYMPDGLRVQDEDPNTCSFIAERAHRILFDFEAIGEHVIGSFENENQTAELVLREINKIQNSMNHELFDLELDVQVASGAYIHWHMVNMYHGVQNIVVKLAPKNTTSESYLLINSHFDSKPGSPGTGDAATMIVIMMEMLRVLASGKCAPFVHPIVFLFNGAEEAPLQTSHAFITQHKWAKNCKALFNLDSAGSGHREILFQSGPNHPWLMNLYRKHVRRPYATSVAEEIFQTGMLPSDTDFRIFRDFGSLPGLDFAHSYNGYVYHTEFDKLDVIPLGTLQITGEHMLALAQGFANAIEFEDTAKYAEGHTVFYDFLGLFFMYYTETQGIIINVIVSVAAFVVPGISLWRVSKLTSMPLKKVLISFGLMLLLQLLGFIMAFGFPLLIAVFYDLDDRSMTWFTNKWLIIGQYVCPSIVGLALPPVIYMTFQKKTQLSKSFQVQMALHSQGIILGLLCIIFTGIGLRSSYILMIPTFFYVCALIINLVSRLHDRGFLWIIPLVVSQIMPFLYFTYLIHALLCTLIPMTSRIGIEANPDIYVSGMTALGTVLSMGFIIPVLSAFRRPKSILLSLMVVMFIFTMMSVSHLGFPYRPKTHVGRYNFLHVRRVFYNYDKTVERNDSGYYFDLQDRHLHYPIQDYVNLTGLQEIEADCDTVLMCGVPTFNHRWYKARKTSRWLPSPVPIETPGKAELTHRRRTVDVSTSTVRFEFTLTGPSQMGIFIQPLKGSTVKNWSFLKDMLEDRDQYQPPYHIFYGSGINSPVNFYIDIHRDDGNFDGPVFELGIAAHYLDRKHPRGEVVTEFLSKFPKYVHVMEWPSFYEKYVL